MIREVRHGGNRHGSSFKKLWNKAQEINGVITTYKRRLPSGRERQYVYRQRGKGGIV